MRCIIWAAVSSKSQASDEKDSIPSQISAARELIQGNEGWHEIVEPLTIPGHSRFYIFLADAAADMPVYTELMSLARENKIDLLICRGRDRLGRKDALIAQVEEYLASYNVQIYSMSMPTRVQDPKEFAEREDRASIWMRSIERAKAQDEITELQQRCQMGMASRIRKRGLHASNLPYGYRLGPEGHGIIYEPEAKIVRKIFDWFLEGKSYEEITQLAQLYAEERYPNHHARIRYMIEHPYYAGHVSFRRFDKKKQRFRDRSEWIMARGRHEAIISQDLWDLAQIEMTGRMQQSKRQRHNPYPLSGFVFCGYCGRGMSVTPGKGAGLYQYYVCRRKDCAKPTKRNSVRLDRLEPKIIDWLIDRATRPEILSEDLSKLAEAAGNASHEDIQRLEAGQRQTVRALEQWREDYEDQLIRRSEYYTNRNRLLDQLEKIQSELEEQRTKIERLDPERITDQLHHAIGESIDAFKEAWEDRSNVKQVKALFRQIGLRITITTGEQETAISL